MPLTAWLKVRADSNSRSRGEVVIMSQVIMLVAVFGAVLLLGSAAAWRPAGLPAQPGGAEPTPLLAPAHARTVSRCGGERVSVGPVPTPPMPNAYMTLNGRVFTLADVLACANRLHRMRFI
jgi:hypothetical protein